MKIPNILLSAVLALVTAGIILQVTILREIDQRLTRVETKVEVLVMKPRP